MSLRPTLKSTLTVSFLIAACLPLILAGAVFLRFFSDTVERGISERNFITAKTMAGEVNRFLGDYRDVLGYAADQMEIQEVLPVHESVVPLENMIKHHRLLDSMKVLDREGKIITLAPFQPDHVRLDFSGHPFVKQAITTGKTVWSNVYLSSHTGYPAVSLAVPFRSGIIVGDMNLAVLQEITEDIKIGSHGYTAMCDRVGITIAHPDRTLIAERLNVKNLSMIRHGLAGEEGTFPYRFRGEARLGSVAGVSETGWLMVVIQLEKEAFAPILKTKTLLWTVILFIALASLMTAGYFLRKIIAPYSRLAAMTTKISKGDYRIESLPASYPEIDRLAENFKSMAEAVQFREEALQGSKERLRQSERQLKDIHDSVSDLIYTHDLKGRLLTVNQAMTTVFGYKREELVDRYISDFMKPELTAIFETEYLNQIKNRHHDEGVFALFAKDGHKLYIEYSNVLVKPEDGVAFISGIGRDVTQRVLSDRIIKEREERIHAILEATPIPLVVYDFKGCPLFLNPAFITVFGWTLDELQNRHIPFVPEDQQQKSVEAIKALYRKEELGALETQRLTKDGRLLDILISAALTRGDGEEPSGMVVSLNDLTEKKKMEAGMLQAQKMEAIGTLAGGIAHDFNNLLMAIQGNISLMIMDLGADHPLYHQLKDIEQYTNQGAALTRQLLGFAKGGKYEVRPLNINELIKAHNHVFGRTRKEIRIHGKYEENLWAVAADRGQMEQVLMNLYINASHAMPEGGDIFVETMNVSLKNDNSRPFRILSGRYVQISLIDTGIGMDKATRQRIFDPFFTTKKMGRGTGLGLASVYGIIKNHDGFIEADSEVGKGATFNLYLPAVKDKVIPADRKKKEKEPLLKGEGTILLVDDEEMILDIGQAMLQRIGYSVITCLSAKEAIATYRMQKAKIDLVIVDMIMPEMGGGELFDHLKVVDPQVNVLLSSGYSVDGQAQEILDRGCKGFIQKPFDLRRLSQKIRETS